jgi:Xaa-Pro dipeptidase
MLEERLRRLYARQRAAGVDCVALVPGANMRYVTDMSLFMSERPIVAFLVPDGRPAALLPALEKGRAQAMAGDGIDLFVYSDQEGADVAFARASSALGLSGKRCAVEYLNMRVLELRALEAAAPDARFVSLEDALPGLRAIKDGVELAAIREAIAITEQALHALISRPLIGLSEREIASRLSGELMEVGADAVGFLIAVAGPNGADPHAGPSDRPVQSGEFLTIDCGIFHDGYLSDITRTVALGPVSAALTELYEVVRQANAAGRAAVGPGIAAQEVDRAARRVIADAGYGDRFIHRTGHGLGMETHEPPYIVEGNEELLQPGMVFTVEPGVYVPGLGGVRIEDNVVVTSSGVECLTSFPREMLQIG